MSEFLPEQSGPPQAPAQAYGQPQPMQMSAPPAPSAAFTGPPAGRPWLLAAMAGVVAGVVAAFIYAAVSFIVDREVLMLVMAVGGFVGFVVGKVSAREGFANGLVAVLVAAPATLLAAALLVVFTTAGSIPEGLSRLADVDVAAVLRVYFSDFLGFVWFGASVVVAFMTSVGVNASSD